MAETDRGDEYAGIAPFYDPLLGPALIGVRRAICRRVQRARCPTILDICCGTGRLCKDLAKLGCRVTGVDVSPAMLGIARRTSPPRIRYHLEDATSLSFPDASFACAVLSFALHEQQPATRRQLLAQARRVLRPDGKLLIVDYVQPIGRLAEVAHPLIHTVERAAGRSHYLNFRGFMASGGLEGFVAEQGLSISDAQQFFLGTVALVLCDWDRY